MMRYTRSFLGLLIFLAISAEGLAGIWTTNEFFYKPSLVARGEREKSTYDSGLDRVDVRLVKEVWVGDPKFGATLQDVLTTLGATTARLRVPKGTYNLDANLTIPPNITLKPERGAIFAIVDTKTLTINGGLEAGLFQIFSCAGTGKVVFAAGSNQTIFPQWWGASPTASAMINNAAIQASFNTLASYTSWTLPPGDYTCDASLVIGSYGDSIHYIALQSIEMNFKGNLRFVGCSGLDLRGIRHSNLRRIQVIRSSIDWAANNFGVKFGKCRNIDVELHFIQNFTYGFYLDVDYSFGHSNAYMNFHLGQIQENQYGQYAKNLNCGCNNEFNYYVDNICGHSTQAIAYGNVSIADNTLTQPSVAWRSEWITGYAVYFSFVGNTCPAPLVQGTTYYVIRDAAVISEIFWSA